MRKPSCAESSGALVVHETRLALVSNREDKDDVVGGFDEKPVQLSRTYKITYTPLLRQYRLSAGSAYQNFTRFEDVVGALEAVERDIAAVATRDHQLSQFALCRPPDQGMLGEYRHRAGDQFDRGSCAGSVGGQQEVK
mgnify:CR=1 FL=1